MPTALNVNTDARYGTGGHSHGRPRHCGSSGHLARVRWRASGQSFVHVTDAVKLWKHLRNRNTAGVGPIADQEYGLREFVLTAPDGNKVRFGTPPADPYSAGHCTCARYAAGLVTTPSTDLCGYQAQKCVALWIMGRPISSTCLHRVPTSPEERASKIQNRRSAACGRWKTYGLGIRCSRWDAAPPGTVAGRRYRPPAPRS